MDESSVDFTSLFEQSDLALFVADHAGRCVLTSDALCALLGFEVRPNFVDEFWPSFQADPQAGPGAVAEFSLASGESLSVRVDFYPLAGAQLYIVAAQPAEAEADGAHPELLQAAQVRAERLQTLGMLAGGIAHDFNNVLTGILGHISFLKTVLPRSGTHLESVAAIEEGARKGTSMIQQILNFSKANAEEKPAPIDLGAVVKSSVRLLRGAMPIGCHLDCSVPDMALQVLAPEGRLTQILINLVVNSRDAVGANGTIQVRVDSTDDADELNNAFRGADLSSMQYARISVRDNGHGISEEVQRRMFEPYFSTKKAMGTGLGLATVLQTVRQYGGAITVASEVGAGTEIVVYLPMLRPATATRVADGGNDELVAGGRERILIVDDEYPVRNVLSVSLEHLGYEVVTASSGAEALEKYRQTDRQFDLVILDMIMPNMSGDRVFFELLSIDPRVRVLVISGYSSEAAVQAILDNGGLDFMAKPFTIEDLSRKVRQCIAAQ